MQQGRIPAAPVTAAGHKRSKVRKRAPARACRPPAAAPSPPPPRLLPPHATDAGRRRAGGPHQEAPP
jgi:hypothetical protein